MFPYMIRQRPIKGTNQYDRAKDYERSENLLNRKEVNIIELDLYFMELQENG